MTLRIAAVAVDEVAVIALLDAVVLVVAALQLAVGVTTVVIERLAGLTAITVVRPSA